MPLVGHKHGHCDRGFESVYSLEDSFRVGMKEISTLTHTKGDGVYRRISKLLLDV